MSKERKKMSEEEKTIRPKYVVGGTTRKMTMAEQDKIEAEEECDRELREYIALSRIERDIKAREDALKAGKTIPIVDVASSDINPFYWYNDSQCAEAIKDYEIRRAKFGEEKMEKYRKY